jgi:hypothetical protein
LAVETRTPVLSWVEAMDHDPGLISTAVDVLSERAKQLRRKGR